MKGSLFMSFQNGDIFQLDYWKQLFSENILSYSFLINIVDIIVVWYLLYKLLQLVRGTKAIQLLKGVLVFLVIRFIAEFLGLHTLSWLMDQVITYGVIAAVVIFQPEIRRGLEHLGRTKFFATNSVKEREEEQIIKALDKAVQYMSKRKIGALITIERNTGLEEYIETGIPLDADISGELLTNIFIPNTPLHDGAVIIRDGKVAVACAYLPLSDSILIPKEYGTRHRAAVGISEVSDAVTLVVSEETGGVSITINNQLIPDLTKEDYLAILTKELSTKEQEKKRQNVLNFLTSSKKSARKKGGK